MSVLIAASAVRTCLGDSARTYAGLLAGATGLAPLRCGDPDALHVRYAYQVPDPDPAWRASRWLSGCVARALRESGVDPRRRRVAAVVGTGLRELREVERWADAGPVPPPDRLHFAAAVRAVAGIDEVCTLANACSAGGHALALGQDLLELDEADAVVVAAADTLTESMLAVIGRVADRPTERIQPFDVDRAGVLLGEGAAALVLVREPEPGRAPLAKLLATGLSCDAYHETAPDPAGIRRAVDDALHRARRSAGEVDLVVAHGTGTALNDPAEAAVLDDVYAGAGPGPLVTAVKGALGHTSGAAALHGVAVAVECLREGRVPAIAGLHTPIPEAKRLRLVRDQPAPAAPRTAQVNAFGFGGVNAVSLLEAVT